MLDREYETSSTGEDSASESHRNQLSGVNGHAKPNGGVYASQNGSLVRTRRISNSNNGKLSSPARLGKQFKKLDRLEATQEERVPLNNGAEDEQNLTVRASGSAGTEMNVDELESTVESMRDTLGSHSDRTQSDEEELWMGPWNNLHIPMTKL